MTQVTVRHDDWRAVPAAVADPWVVVVNGSDIQRHGDAGSAGAHARAIADVNGVSVDWDGIR